MKNKKINVKILFGILLLLVVFFGAFIIYNENILNSGETIYLKTTPVDPRDLLRGDYVILSYEIADDSRTRNLIIDENLSNFDSIYFILEKDENEVGYLKEVRTTKPEGVLYLKGLVDLSSETRTSVELGIGKYFIPEGRGYEVERLRGELEVLVSIGNYGAARIKHISHNNTIIDFKK